MTDEAVFVLAIAAAPDDTAASLAYADWLQACGDRRAELLRLWSELFVVPYGEATFGRIHDLATRYREQVSQADPNWLVRLGRVRAWVSRGVAEKLVRVYLRVHHGRKEDRQRIGFQSWPWGDEWHMYYWRQPPSHKQTSWRGKSWLWVNKVSGEIRDDHHW
jgi:uncharacterized protein (TIGR02996 family)